MLETIEAHANLMDTPFEDTAFKKAKILIVDDDPKNIELLRQTLEGAGYNKLRATGDPREGCDIYGEFWPDLLLLDLNMPYMDGFQVMEELIKVERRLAICRYWF